MINPRLSDDPQLKAALRAWDNANPYRGNSFEEAMGIRTALRDTGSHQAFGWAALTCGRIAAHRQQVELAEVLLAEAMGRLHLIGDTYGEELAVSHLAVPQITRRNLDRALALALRPLSSSVTFSDRDKCLLHNIAAECYWAKEEPLDAILHLNKAYDLVKNTGDFEKQSAVIGNLGTALQVLEEWDLALAASEEAWRLQTQYCADPSEYRLNHLSQLVLVNFILGNKRTALRQAEQLLEYLTPASEAETSLTYLILVDAFSLNDEVEKAKFCLQRAHMLSAGKQTPFLWAHLQTGEATLLAAQHDYVGAIIVAKRVIEQPVDIVKRGAQRSAARVLASSYAALGRNGEAAKWKRFAGDQPHNRLLGGMLQSQIRANLKVEQPAEPLTEKELACLSLAAHGQTSADIGLKLGITTRTVNFHFAKILRKLNAANRQEAIAKAANANLLQRP